MVASIGGEEEDFDATDNLPDLSSCKEFYTKYEIKEVLGSGVTSIVRRCIEKLTHREFAVKMIDLTQETDNEELMEEYREATKKEINILRQCCDHPYIIELHDTFESSAFIFLVFEICKTGELFDYLTEVVTLSEKRTRQIMRQLFDAVEFIHAKNIVHRDLKPENILLDDDFNVKLLDFGFASVISHDEELRDLCGTPGYLSPDALKVSMIDNSPGYGKPVDMWAAGVIMFTLLVGLPPFWHRKQMIMLRTIMEGKYTFSSPEWDDISEIAKDLISKLLVVDPKKRLTAPQALGHQFFKREERQKMEFLARRKFKGSAFVVVAMNRMMSQHRCPPSISLEDLKENPYRMRNFRKAIDGGAFKIYGHWVNKKGDNQNRAALFENNIKRDMKLSSSFLRSGDLSGFFDQFAPTVDVQDRVGRAPPVGIAGGSGAGPLILITAEEE